jgi:hypothetical protein
MCRPLRSYFCLEYVQVISSILIVYEQVVSSKVVVLSVYVHEFVLSQWQPRVTTELNMLLSFPSIRPVGQARVEQMGVSGWTL